MCYGPGPELDATGKPVYKLPTGEYMEPQHPELIEIAKDNFHYPKKHLATIRMRPDSSLEVVPMRFDLIHPGYLSQERYKHFTIAEIAAKKNSRAINPDTGEKWGYDAYNARSESIATKWTFKDAWRAAQRCVIPTTRFLERPNMKEAPSEFKNREWKVCLSEHRYFGCIWDRIERFGEALESCAIVTLTSEGHPIIRSIWHERMPVLLTAAEAMEWVNPATPMTRIKQLIKQLEPQYITLEEWIRPKKTA